MMRIRTQKRLLGLAMAASLSTPVGAVVVYTPVTRALTTEPKLGGGCCDGIGVWYCMLAGATESRDFARPDRGPRCGHRSWPGAQIGRAHV